MCEELRGFDGNALVGSEGQSDVRLEVARLTDELANSRAREATYKDALHNIAIEAALGKGNHHELKVNVSYIARAALSASEDATD